MRLMIQLGVFALRVCSTRADRGNNFDEIRIARRTCVDCKARQKHELTLYRMVVTVTSSICDVQVPSFVVFTVLGPVLPSRNDP